MGWEGVGWRVGWAWRREWAGGWGGPGREWAGGSGLEGGVGLEEGSLSPAGVLEVNEGLSCLPLWT